MWLQPTCMCRWTKSKKKKARTFHGEELRANPFLFYNCNCVLLSVSLRNALHKRRKTWVLIQWMDFTFFFFFFFCPFLRGERGFDKRQRVGGGIRGVSESTCLRTSAWWYGMAPSSSGAILSMSAWFSRLNKQQWGKKGVGPGKKSPSSTVNTSQGCKIFHRPFIGI